MYFLLVFQKIFWGRIAQTPLQGLGLQHVNSINCGEIAGLAPGRPFYLLQDKCAFLFRTVQFGLRQGNNLNLTRGISLSKRVCNYIANTDLSPTTVWVSPTIDYPTKILWSRKCRPVLRMRRSKIQ